MRQNIVVIDYGSGNLASAARGLEAAAEKFGLRADIHVSSDPDIAAGADRIVLPGQGAFADCAAGLAQMPGLLEAVLHRVAEGAPYLGICVGMQLMAVRGLEHVATAGFGWIDGEIAPLAAPSLRLPHMGWNELLFEVGAHPLLAGLRPGDHGYFVHSYGLRGGRAGQTIATTDYGGPVVAMVAEKNRAGTQFHVEKSQSVGLRILGNFLQWQP